MDLWALLCLKPCILRLYSEKLSHKDRFLKSNHMNDWIIYRFHFSTVIQAHLAFCRYVWVDLLTEDICFGGAHLELFGGQHFHLLHFRNLPASYPSSYASIFPQPKGNGGGGRFQFEPPQKVTLGRWSSVLAFSGFLKTTQVFGSKMKPRPNANRVIKRTQTSCLGNHSTRISQGWSVPKSRTNRHVYILRGMVERWRLETLDHQLAVSVRELILPYWEISSKPKN